MKCADDEFDGKKTLSARQEQTLRDQAITCTRPGPILHDFAAMLRYVQANNVALSNTGLLPMKALRPLNETMHRPLEVGLTRPHLQSFPNIEGLFMVLRASGLVRVEHKGKRRMLRLDESTVDGWEQLNEVEQYFCLLRTWLLRADHEVIRDRCSSMRPILPECIDFVTGLPRLLKTYPRDVMDYLRFRPCHFNVALAELFGLVAIEQQPARKGQGWTVSHIKTTPFGQSLSALLIQIAGVPFGFFPMDDETCAFEHWHKSLVLYFPQLQKESLWSQEEPMEGVHVLTVSLGDAWRQLALPHTCALDTLAGTILDAFAFDRDHLYVFEVEDRFGSMQEIKHFYMDEPPYAHETTIGEFGLQPGQHMVFRYDFGENWRFEIVVDRVDLTDRRMRRPKQLKTHGEAPPQYDYPDDDGELLDDDE